MVPHLWTGGHGVTAKGLQIHAAWAGFCLPLPTPRLAARAVRSHPAQCGDQLLVGLHPPASFAAVQLFPQLGPPAPSPHTGRWHQASLSCGPPKGTTAQEAASLLTRRTTHCEKPGQGSIGSHCSPALTSSDKLKMPALAAALQGAAVGWWLTCGTVGWLHYPFPGWEGPELHKAAIKARHFTGAQRLPLERPLPGSLVSLKGKESCLDRECQPTLIESSLPACCDPCGKGLQLNTGAQSPGSMFWRGGPPSPNPSAITKGAAEQPFTTPGSRTIEDSLHKGHFPLQFNFYFVLNSGSQCTTKVKMNKHSVVVLSRVEGPL